MAPEDKSRYKSARCSLRSSILSGSAMCVAGHDRPGSFVTGMLQSARCPYRSGLRLCGAARPQFFRPRSTRDP
jgi:hypothetical protein